MKISNETPLFPLRKGTHTRQAHVNLPEGTFEEEHGRKGFYGKVSHLYRLRPQQALRRQAGRGHQGLHVRLHGGLLRACLLPPQR